MNEEFYKKLRSLLNSYAIDSYCSTPDYILVNLIAAYIQAQRSAMEELHRNHDTNELLDFNFRVGEEYR